MKTVAIFLPTLCLTPSGGYKVIFDYANRLSASGWKVQFVHPMFMLAGGRLWLKLIKGVARSILLFACRDARRPKWFNLDASIKVKIVPTLSQRFVPVADVYIATAANTAYYLMQYRNCSAAYFVQGYETWILEEKILFETYRSSLTKLVISNWLAARIQELKRQSVTVIPNGLDFTSWGCDVSHASRLRHSVALMYHPAEYKRFNISFKAMLALKAKYPDLVVKVFGVYPRPNELPEWCLYTYRPTHDELRAIYNESSVYVAMSSSEGWGLTVGEAMACGCVVCCSACKGYLEMVTDRKNALVCAVDDVAGLCGNVSSVFDDRNMAKELSKNASIDIRKFSKERSFGILEESLSSIKRQERFL